MKEIDQQRDTLSVSPTVLEFIQACSKRIPLINTSRLRLRHYQL